MHRVNEILLLPDKNKVVKALKLSSRIRTNNRTLAIPGQHRVNPFSKKELHTNLRILHAKLHAYTPFL